MECSCRKECSVGGGSGAGFIDSLVKTGKWSDGDQWVQDSKRQPEQVTCRKIKNVIFVVHSEVNVLTKIERRKKRQKLRGESVCRIIEMNVEVTGNDKFMGSGCSKRQKRTEVIEENKEWFGISDEDGGRIGTIDIED